MIDRLFWLQLIASFVGTAGFALMFRLNAKLLPWVILGGGLTFFVYDAVETYMSSVFAAAFISSAVSALYAEFCARLNRAPAVVFILTCAIPIVPGGSLYRTMFHLISKESDVAISYFWQTISVALGIAGGLAAVSLMAHLIVEYGAQIKKKFKS